MRSQNSQHDRYGDLVIYCSCYMSLQDYYIWKIYKLFSAVSAHMAREVTVIVFTGIIDMCGPSQIVNRAFLSILQGGMLK